MESQIMIAEKNVYFWKDENEEPIWKDTYIYAKLNVEE